MLKVDPGHYALRDYAIIRRLQGDWAIYYRLGFIRLSTHPTLKAALAAAQRLERPHG